MDDDFLEDDDTYIPPPEEEEEQVFEGVGGLDPSVVKVAEEHQQKKSIKGIIKELLGSDLDLPGGLILINSSISYVGSFESNAEGIAFEAAVTEALDALTGGAFYNILDRNRIEQRVKLLEFAKYNANSTLMYLEDGDYLDDDNLSKTKHYTTAIMAVVDHGLETSRARYQKVCANITSDDTISPKFHKFGKADARIQGEEPMAKPPERYLDYNDIIDKLFYHFNESDKRYKNFVEKKKDDPELDEEVEPIQRGISLEEPDL